MGVSKAVYNGKTLIDLTQDTVTEAKLLSGYTAHKADGTIINGGITTKQAATYTPTTTDQTFAEDEYLYGNVVLKGDPNLLAENIASGVTIFGVTGTYVPIEIPPSRYTGEFENLSTSKAFLAATSVGGYALFGGGSSGGAKVDAFDIGLTRSTLTDLSYSRFSLAAASVGDYALFGGGIGNDATPIVDAYDLSLTHSAPTALYSKCYDLAATSFGGVYAIFAGGYSSPSSINKVNVYDTSLTRSLGPTLTYGAKRFSAASLKNHAFFYHTVVDVYDISLTKQTIAKTSSAIYNIVGTVANTYALFGGGSSKDTGGTIYDTVDAYDDSLTCHAAPSLSAKLYYIAATHLYKSAIFCGGNYSDSYNSTLTKSTIDQLSISRVGLAAATIKKKYALFGGGKRSASSTPYYDTVDAYTILEQ